VRIAVEADNMIQKNALWKEEEGYVTIEVVFLVTLIFLLVCAVMLSGLYICDLNQAKSFLNRRATELSINEESYESDDLSKDKQRIESQLFVTSLTEFYIVKTKSQVKGKIVLSMKLNVPMIGEWFGQLWTDTFSLNLEVGNHADRMRRWEQIE